MSWWTVGLSWAMIATTVTAVIAITGIAGQLAAPLPLGYLFNPTAILVVPVLVFVGVSLATIVLRRTRG